MKATYLISALSIVLSGAAILPTAARSIELGSDTQPTLEVRTTATAQLANLPEQSLSSIFLRDNPIDARFESSPAILERNYTFYGNENELVVVYFESNPNYFESYYSDIFLKAPSGNNVGMDNHYYYGSMHRSSERDGRHQVFRLPETGEYELAITPGIVFSDDDIARDVQSYLLKIRVADAAERFLLAGNDKMREEDYPAAIALFSQAINYAPDQADPYIGRILATATQSFFVDESIGDTVSGTEGFQILYERLSPEEQRTVISDLQRLAGILHAEVEAGQLYIEDFDPQLAEDMAIYLETGTASASLQTAMDEIW